jgi:hypothetical protein
VYKVGTDEGKQYVKIENSWEEELDREIDLDEIHGYRKKTKSRKAVGVDGYHMEL